MLIIWILITLFPLFSIHFLFILSKKSAQIKYAASYPILIRYQLLNLIFLSILKRYFFFVYNKIIKEKYKRKKNKRNIRFAYKRNTKIIFIKISQSLKIRIAGRTPTVSNMPFRMRYRCDI